MKKTILLFFVLVVFAFSSCVECEMCVRSLVVKENGVVDYTSTQSPFEVCTRADIDAAESSVTSTTVRGDVTRVSIWSTVCN